MRQRRLGRAESGEQAEDADAEVDEIVMKVQAELDGAEIAQAEEPRDGDQRVDRTENEAEAARPCWFWPRLAKSAIIPLSRWNTCGLVEK